MTVVAEKWEATISLGEANARLKDIMDLDELAGTEPFHGAVLQRAVQSTFDRRRTNLDAGSTALTERFRLDPDRPTLWSAARKRYERDRAPELFRDVMNRVIEFVGPPYLEAAAGQPFVGKWDPARRKWVK